MNDIANRRWGEGDGDPASYSMIDALEVMAHRLRSGEIEADHIIIAYGRLDEDGAALTGYAQAGSFNPFMQAGLMRMVQRMFDE